MEYIFASLHAAERERIYGSYDKFLDDVVTLGENGYNVEVCYPLPPYHYDRFRADLERCAERGIKPVLRMFRGKHDGKVYPRSYTESEIREIFLEYAPEYNRDRAFRGSLYGRRCNAGRNLVRVRCNGDVVPCLHDYTLLGNIFTGFKLREEPEVCRSKFCGAWSLETLFDDPGDRFNVEEPPALGLAERYRRKLNQFRGWWQGD